MKSALVGAAVLPLCMIGIRPGPAQSGDHTLYISDPAMGLIYAMPINQTAGPRPITGMTSLQADHLGHLSTDEVVYGPRTDDQTIQYLNFRTGEIQRISGIPPTGHIRAIDAGINPDEFSVLVVDDNGETTLFGGVRSHASAPFELRFIATLPAGDNFARWQLLKYSHSSYAMLDQNSGELWHVAPEAGLFTCTQLEQYETEIPPILMSRGPDGRFLVYARKSSTPVEVFNEAGERISDPVTSSSLFADIPVLNAIHWAADGSQLVILKKSDLIAQDSPYGAEPLTMIYTARPGASAGSPVDPTRDIGGWETLLPIGESKWIGHDIVLDGIFEIDTTVQQRSPVAVYMLGESEPLEEILAMAVAPDGLLQVLVESGETCSILALHPATGVRDLIARNLPRDLVPAIGSDGEGHPLLVHRESRNTSVADPANMTILRLVLGSSADDYTLEPASQPLQTVKPPFDVAASPGGLFDILHPATGPTLTYRYDGSQLMAMDHYLVEASNVEITRPDPFRPYHISGKFQVPENHGRLPAGTLVFKMIYKESYDFDWYWELHLTNPSGETSIIPMRTVRIDYRTDDDSNRIKKEGALMLDEGSMSIGTWSFEMNMDSIYYTEPDFLVEFTLEHRAARHTRQIAVSPDGETWLFESLPPSLVRYDAASYTYDRVPLLVSGRKDLVPPSLGFCSDFLILPAGDAALVAVQDEPTVYRVELATGEAMIYATRPESVSELPHGRGVNPMTLAIGPRITLAPSLVGGWLLH